MQYNDIQPIHDHPTKKRIGRGGKRGKTSGRGHKGQGQHGSHGLRPQLRDIIKKLPKLRGRGMNSNKPIKGSFLVVNLGDLEAVVTAGATVTPALLVELGLISRREAEKRSIKLLGGGTLTKKITVEGVKVSASARAAIEAAGGTVAATQ